MAVQSYGDLEHYRSQVFDALQSGIAVEVALDRAIAADPRRRRAQVGLVSSDGSAAAVTGVSCVDAAGHITGPSFAFQANMCAGPSVWEQGADAYSTSEGDMATRLLAALTAAEAAGGDLRGKQSAVLRVVASPGASATGAVEADLRVDDHPESIAELRRLDAMRRAAAAMSEAFSVAESGDVDAAIGLLEEVQAVFGDNLEPSAWAAVLLARSRRFVEAADLAQSAIRSHAGWAEFLSHLPGAGLLPDDPETRNLLKELANG
jgi:uncharacterized Ntn-hydrolase superfamily protein